jgi:dihydrofolate reductase
VKVVREAADGREVVILGANVARRCLVAGLLDEIIVHVAPLLLGAGVRLCEHSGPPVKLRAAVLTPGGHDHGPALLSTLIRLS